MMQSTAESTDRCSKCEWAFRGGIHSFSLELELGKPSIGKMIDLARVSS